MKKLLFIMLITLSVLSCTDNFEEINTNPNEPETISPDLLLPTVLFDLADFSVNQSYLLGDIVAQYSANYEFNDLDIYNWTSSNEFWVLYDVIQDAEDMIASANGNANYEAVGSILKAYCFSMLTDAYGDVPYFEANSAEEQIITPAYDDQEVIYGEVLALLETANTLINVDETISGDILYGGDMLSWKKFANSLKIRLLMRTAEVNDIGSQLQEMVDDPAQFPVFESVSDDAIYQYSGSIPNLSPYSSGRGREYEYFLGIPTSNFVDLLVANNDPRIDEWLDLREGEVTHLGVDPGQTLGDIGRPGGFSSKSASYFSDPGKIAGVFMTGSELNFLLAEAAERNLISQSAQAYYEAGVSASFAQWGVTMPADFLTVTVPYEAGNLDRIYEQKWLALYHSGTEAWFDWKRTSKPDFIQAGPGNVNGDVVPVRLMYPPLEQSVNATNYSEAAQRMGGDNINSRVWWDNF